MLSNKEQLNYIEYGEQSSRAMVVVLHGLLGSARNLAGVCRHLAEHFRVIAFDLPNHGQSPHVDHISISGMAESLIDEITSRGLLSVSLLGHSLGGKIAMAIALKKPELVTKLVVADIAPIEYKAAHNVILDAMLSLPAEVSSRGDAAEYLGRFIDDSQTAQFLLQNLHKIGNQYQWRCNVQGIANSYEQLRAGLSVDEFPAPFTGSVLFIKGGASDYIINEYLALMAQLFPAYSIAEISGAGHWLHVEKPDEFNELVSDFLL